MQSILSGGAMSSVITSVVVLLGFGVASALISLFAIRKTRTALSLGLVPAIA
jgi:hypothetical protein